MSGLRLAAVLAASFLAGAGGRARADCATAAEVVAAVLFDGDLASRQLTPYRVAVTPVGPATFPSDDEIRGALAAVDSRWSASLWTAMSAAPPFRRWEAWTGDFGAEAIVDDRTGAIAFFGRVTFAGQGSVALPASSTHTIGQLAAPLAAPPTVTVLPNVEWDSVPAWPSSAELTDTATDFLRSTDLGHALADCGETWEVTGHVYTPAVGAVDSSVAQVVVVVRGRPGPPWSPVSVDAVTWGVLKGRWR